eukprot:tig00020920_g15910.t1
MSAPDHDLAGADRRVREAASKGGRVRALALLRAAIARYSSWPYAWDPERSDVADADVVVHVLAERTARTVRYILERLGGSSVYLCILAATRLSEAATATERLAESDLLTSRAKYCEVLAKYVLSEFGRQERLVSVLTHRFTAPGERAAAPRTRFFAVPQIDF